MLEKLEAIHKRFEEMTVLMSDPDVMQDMKKYIKLSKDLKELQPIIDAYYSYRSIVSNIAHAKEVLNKLPMEFAVEAQKLLQISLEGSVG